MPTIQQVFFISQVQARADQLIDFYGKCILKKIYSQVLHFVVWIKKTETWELFNSFFFIDTSCQLVKKKIYV